MKDCQIHLGSTIDLVVLVRLLAPTLRQGQRRRNHLIAPIYVIRTTQAQLFTVLTVSSSYIRLDTCTEIYRTVNEYERNLKIFRDIDLSLSTILIFEFVLFVCLMVFNAGFNNVSVISWRSVLLVEETGENYRPVANH